MAAQGGAHFDIVACPPPRKLGSDGEEVVFDFLKENDVLAGADCFFHGEKKAIAFARLISREIETANAEPPKTFEKGQPTARPRQENGGTR